MVCVYCGAKTKVNNSRHQKKPNQVWRRRICLNCSAMFSTLELPDLQRSLSVKHNDGRLAPFNRDKLFVSVYFSCGHLKDAVDAANALTGTVISKLLKQSESALVDSQTIAKITQDTLKHFNQPAAAQYQAYYLS